MSRIETLLENALAPMLATLGWSLRRQVRYGRYLADFVVSNGARSIVVETDGEEWHKERALEDRMRDRWFLRAEGMATLRFLGKEVMRNPSACATEIIRTIAPTKNPLAMEAQLALGELLL